MKISTRGRYALRFMIDLAQNGKDSYVPLKDISDRQGVFCFENLDRFRF